jgi:uncharacterized membrane protein
MKGVAMELGAVELLIIEFPENRFTGDIAPALADLVEEGTIRLIDLLFVSKDEAGAILALELSSVDGAIQEALGPLFSDPEPLLHDDDIADVGEALDPGSSVAMVLFEHTWANAFRSALVGAGAELIDSLRIAPEAIEAARVALAEAK